MTKESRIELRIYVANSGKYNKGILDGKWLNLPCSDEEHLSMLVDIGIDGVEYEEYAIHDYDCNIKGFTKNLGEYVNISRLSDLAAALRELDEWEIEKLEAVLLFEDFLHIEDIEDLIYERLDNYVWYPDLENEEALGRYWIENGFMDVPARLEPYFDHESFGRDLSLEIDGIFVNGGWIERA